MRNLIPKITGVGLLLLFSSMLLLSCTEQPSRTNPYDPEENSPPYTITGKIFTEGDVPEISSFSLKLELGSINTEEPEVTPDIFNNRNIYSNVNSDTLKINWVNTEDPLQLSARDTLLTIEWEVVEPLKNKQSLISDFMLVNSETGEEIDTANLNSKVRVE